jgi:hypothetical protein
VVDEREGGRAARDKTELELGEAFFEVGSALLEDLVDAAVVEALLGTGAENLALHAAAGEKSFDLDAAVERAALFILEH